MYQDREIIGLSHTFPGCLGPQIERRCSEKNGDDQMHRIVKAKLA